MVSQAVVYGVRGMLDIYMKEDMDLSHTDISLSFLIWGALFTASVFPSGWVIEDFIHTQ